MCAQPVNAAAAPTAAWVTARAVWVAVRPDAPPRVVRVPEEPTTGETCFLTNRPDVLRDVLGETGTAQGWWAVDFTELYQLVCPASAAETLPEMLAALDSGRAPEAASDTEDPAVAAASLWRAWQVLANRLEAWPLWAVEAIELLHRELRAHDLARLLGRLAEHRRRHGAAADGNWAASFAVEAGRPVRRAMVAPADCTPVDPAAAAALLAPGGALARQVAGYEPRPGQQVMVQAVAAAFNAGQHLMVEAGTGVGKSLAYLLPAALWARRNDVPVIVSTNTRNLQTQLLEKDLPLIERVLAEPDGTGDPPRALRVALIKGRSNYLCLRRLGFLLEHGHFDLDPVQSRQFARALAWAVQTRDGDLDELAGGSGVEGAFLGELGSQGEECPGRSCRHVRRCFLQKARDRALRADIVVANHALVFAELGTPGVALPPHAQIVFDEAHNLEEAATRHFAVEISPARLRLLVRRLAPAKRRHAGGVLESLKRHADRGTLEWNEDAQRTLRSSLREIRSETETLLEAGRHLFEALLAVLDADQEPKRFGPLSGIAAAEPTPAWARVRTAATAIKAAAEQVSARLAALASRLRVEMGDELPLLASEAAELEGTAQLLKMFALDVDFVLSGADAEQVCWVQRVRGRAAEAEAWAAPLNVGPRLAGDLYASKASVIFCSATLQVGGSFAFLAGRLGIDRIPPERLRTCIAPSPFDYARQCAVFVPVFLPEPGATDRSYATELAGLMREVAQIAGGRTLGLFTSYEMMTHCARLLTAPLRTAGIRLLVQGQSGSRDQITRIFRRGESCVLLGTHSFWEGVDVVGDALSCLVMARLPFAAVNDPVVEARCERLEAEGHRAFTAFSLPAAVIRFRQGFGRLIRHREDRGIVILADTRVVSKHYGSWFRRSLPCRVVACEARDGLLAQVREFLK